MSSLIFVNSHLGQKSPWTKVCLDNCHKDKSLLGQLAPWTIVPWTIVATPDMILILTGGAYLYAGSWLVTDKFFRKFKIGFEIGSKRGKEKLAQ